MDEVFGTAEEYAEAYYNSDYNTNDQPPSYQTAAASSAIVAYYYAIERAQTVYADQAITDAIVAESLYSLDQESFWGLLKWEEGSGGAIEKEMLATQIQINAGKEGIFPVVAPQHLRTTRMIDDAEVPFEMAYPTKMNVVADVECGDDTNDEPEPVIPAPTSNSCFPGKSKVVLGVVLSDSGKYATKADHLRRGYKLAVDRINHVNGGVSCGGEIFLWNCMNIQEMMPPIKLLPKLLRRIDKQ
eukprot:UN33801